MAHASLETLQRLHAELVCAGVYQLDALLLANVAHLVSPERLEKATKAMAILLRHRTEESVQTLATVTHSLERWAKQRLADVVVLLAVGSREPVANLARPLLSRVW